MFIQLYYEAYRLTEDPQVGLDEDFVKRNHLARHRDQITPAT